MATKYCITPSLLNSFLFMQSIKDPEKRKDKEVEMLSQLRKEPLPTMPAAAKGNEFEALIEGVTKGGNVEEAPIKEFPEEEFKRKDLFSVINSIAAIVKGGTWQERVRGTLAFEEDEDSYLLYGRMDTSKPNIIYDIKYTGRRKLNKFASSTQHRLYMYCTGVEKFSYLISDGKDWWREDYFKSVHDKEFLGSIIKEFRAWLSTNEEADKAFKDKWLAT